MGFNIVLVEPEIPTNTGNIGRTCVGSKSNLHLVHPLGFEITDKRLKRAGLDYWSHLNVTHHDNFEAWYSTVSDKSRIFYFTTKTDRPYFSVNYQAGDYFVFGKETKGLPESLLNANPDNCVTIPFPGKIRSFNLSNTVAMAIGEGMRQLYSI